MPAATDTGDAGHSPAAPVLHVVLHEPEIPNNTGNIGRTCVALGAALHLIHPMGFDISEKACRRAGLDYWPRLSVSEHTDWACYKDRTNGAARSAPARWCLTTKADRSVFDAAIEPGDHLVFGKESRGLPRSILAEDRDRCVSLPMVPGERSLNLSTAVCAVVYCAVRRFVAEGHASLDDAGRLVTPTRAHADDIRT